MSEAESKNVAGPDRRPLRSYDIDSLEEIPLNYNQRVRQTHRWLAVVFTTAILVNIALNALPLGNEELAIRVGMLTLIPLALLLITGLYLFVLPYVGRARTRARTDS